jgi:N-methylhydantoinase B/oxoprolinase/acetone carboxylase alpha subunit
MQAAVRYQVEHWSANGGIQEGDVLLSNHPQKAGGSHLPDITVITPVFHEGEIIFFVASRGHHADIGGISPGTCICLTGYYPGSPISPLLQLQDLCHHIQSHWKKRVP